MGIRDWLKQFLGGDEEKAARAVPAAEAPSVPAAAPEDVLIDTLDEIPRAGFGRAQTAIAAFEALPAERWLDRPFTVGILKRLFIAFGPGREGVSETLALAQVALNRFSRMKSVAQTKGEKDPPLDWVEGLLLMRTGRFDAAIEKLAEGNRAMNFGEVEDWRGMLPTEGRDPLVRCAAQAAETLENLGNPDLRFWGGVACSLPVDKEAVIDPEELLMAAGDLILALHGAAAHAVTLDREERLAILTRADARYKALFDVLHPEADDCRRMMAAIERLFGVVHDRDRGEIRG
ncbi:hypothetical protein [Sutterella sp.]|uniref:hypothetical protein n=1 Tax=Sutterella sp. TaxID=1981025 RepID=UPI0026DF59F3|nr:hypothetical protein [Sutterella sp.]MDO5530762.1 hypothetical protein [Sutterella sp.]